MSVLLADEDYCYHYYYYYYYTAITTRAKSWEVNQRLCILLAAYRRYCHSTL